MPKELTEKQLRDRDVADSLLQAAADLQHRNGVSRNRVITTAFARDEIFVNQIVESISKIMKNRIVARKYQTRRKKDMERQLNLVLSDLHFGANLDPREVPRRYGHHEEARRLAAVVIQAAEYKRHYRDETTLVLHLLGDIIQNILHDPRDGLPLAEQTSTAIYLLVQAIVFLSSQFPRIEVRCATGNHGRFTSRHKERATAQKWDSIETVIYYAVKTATAHLPNVSFEIGYRPYYTWGSFADRGMATHGDTVIKPGFPNSSVDVKSMRNQLNEFNAPRTDVEKVKLFVCGHVHTAAVVELPNGVSVVTNGALIPIDPYGESINIHDTVCGQQLWESVPGYIMGDHRFLRVDENTDADASLEGVIKPFLGF